MKSHRSYTPDPTRIVVAVLMPLLATNIVLWKLAEHGWIAGIWFLAFIGSFVFLRRG